MTSQALNLYQGFPTCKNSEEVKIDKEFYQAQTREAMEDDTLFVARECLSI